MIFVDLPAMTLGALESGLGYATKNEDEFFYYHFYYEIKCEKGKIVLSRCSRKDKTDYRKPRLVQFDDNTQYKKTTTITTYDDYGFPHKQSFEETDYKKIFTTINERAEYLKPCDEFDYSNQSDCVAFLHAMGAKEESKNESKETFEKHLKKCFAEYLYIKDKNEALFILGIALHSIMDSFTPSHMDFQKYTEQDMAQHAQGDVMPFKIRNYRVKKSDDSTNIIHTFNNGEMGFSGDNINLKDYRNYIIDAAYEETKDIVTFDPGQFVADGWKSKGKTMFAALKKGFNADDHINEVEFKMLKTFLAIGDIRNDEDIKKIEKNEYDLSRINCRYVGGMAVSLVFTEPRSRFILNQVLKKKEYGEQGFIYSESAITAIKLVYTILIIGRNLCLEGFDAYKQKKDYFVNKAYDRWKSIYDSISYTRNSHIELDRYKKEPQE